MVRRGLWGIYLIFLGVVSTFSISIAKDLDPLFRSGFVGTILLYHLFIDWLYYFWSRLSYRSFKILFAFPGRRVRRFFYHGTIWVLHFLYIPKLLTMGNEFLFVLMLFTIGPRDILYYFIGYIYDFFTKPLPGDYTFDDFVKDTELDVLHEKFEVWWAEFKVTLEYYRKIFAIMFWDCIYPILDIYIILCVVYPLIFLFDYCYYPFIYSRFYSRYKAVRRFNRIQFGKTPIGITYNNWYAEWLDDWYGLARQYDRFGGFGYLSYIWISMFLVIYFAGRLQVHLDEIEAANALANPVKKVVVDLGPEFIDNFFNWEDDLELTTQLFV